VLCRAAVFILFAMLLGAADAETETEAAPAPAERVLRWTGEKYVWHYSRALQPEWLEPGLGLYLFRAAAEAWQACGVRIEFAGETDLPAGRIDGANVVGWSASMRHGMRGITLRRQAAGALLEADVAINGTSRELRASPDLLRKVVLHEFGHALGLVHSQDCADVMSFGAWCRGTPASELAQRPTAGDLAQCARRYPGGRAPG
jgi:Matrixin